MPRKARMFLPGVPCHVVTRGNNRNSCFYERENYEFYLQCLLDACQRHEVSLHAYVLMTNHAHLLMTPACKDGISQVMQSVGRRYVQYINLNYHRSGTLWEGRHKSSLVDSETYVLACYRYIELNPVRAGMVSHPSDYHWSSYQINAGLSPWKDLIPHETYQTLSRNKEQREEAYRDLFQTELGVNLMGEIRRSAQFSMPLGNKKFQQEISLALGRKLGQACRGRPKVKRE